MIEIRLKDQNLACALFSSSMSVCMCINWDRLVEESNLILHLPFAQAFPFFFNLRKNKQVWISDNHFISALCHYFVITRFAKPD